MRYLTVMEVLTLHRAILERTGGAGGLREPGCLDSAVAQPQMAFGGSQLYPTLEEKAVAIGFSLIKNHPFVDGNKRVGYAALETFLVLNGFEIVADADDAEQMVLGVAATQQNRDAFLAWVRSHVRPLRTQ